MGMVITQNEPDVQPKGQQICFTFGRSRVQITVQRPDILTEGTRCRDSTSNWATALPSTTFPIHYSFIIISFKHT
jgi:hypothetical protein